MIRQTILAMLVATTALTLPAAAQERAHGVTPGGKRTRSARSIG
jgi:hypothetical protein